MYSAVTIVNNVIYLKYAERVDLNCSQKKKNLCEVMRVFISLVVVMISHICIYQNITLYTLNVYNFYLSICFNRAEKKLYLTYRRQLRAQTQSSG